MAIAIVCGLCLHVLLCGWVLDRWLARAAWVSRSPKTALLVWQALGFATIASVLGACVLLAHDALEHLLLWALDIDKGQLHLAYAGQRQVPVAWNLSLAAGALALAALTISIARSCRAAERKRAAHRRLRGQILGRDRDGTVLVVAGTAPFAYCLPKRRLRCGEARIVVSDAALDELSADQLAAVVAHERAHLSGRHHVLVTVANAVTALTRRLGLLTQWGEQTARLVELAADDRAARECGRPTVARALLAMATPRSSGLYGPRAGLLAAGSSEMSERIRRLLPVRSAAGPERPLGTVVAVAVAAVPVVAIILPAVVAAGLGAR